MSEVLENLSLSQSEFQAPAVEKTVAPNEVVGKITFEPLELAIQGVMFSCEHGGMDRAAAFRLRSTWTSMKRTS